MSVNSVLGVYIDAGKAQSDEHDNASTTLPVNFATDLSTFINSHEPSPAIPIEIISNSSKVLNYYQQNRISGLITFTKDVASLLPSTIPKCVFGMSSTPISSENIYNTLPAISSYASSLLKIVQSKYVTPSIAVIDVRDGSRLTDSILTLSTESIHVTAIQPMSTTQLIIYVQSVESNVVIFASNSIDDILEAFKKIVDAKLVNLKWWIAAPILSTPSDITDYLTTSKTRHPYFDRLLFVVPTLPESPLFFASVLDCAKIITQRLTDNSATLIQGAFQPIHLTPQGQRIFNWSAIGISPTTSAVTTFAQWEDGSASLSWLHQPSLPLDTSRVSPAFSTTALAVSLSLAGSVLIALFIGLWYYRKRRGSKSSASVGPNGQNAKLEQPTASTPLPEHSSSNTHAPQKPAPRRSTSNAVTFAAGSNKNANSRLQTPVHQVVETLLKIRQSKAIGNGISRHDIDDILRIVVATSSTVGHIPDIDAFMDEKGATLDDDTKKYLMENIIGSGNAADLAFHSKSIRRRSHHYANGSNSGNNVSGQNSGAIPPMLTRRKSIATTATGNTSSLAAGASLSFINSRQQSIGTDISNSIISDELRLLEINQADLDACLQSAVTDWDFDSFRLAEVTRGRPLYHLGLFLLQRHNLLQPFSISEEKIKIWLEMIESNYNHYPYHNSIHAADVLAASNFLLLENKSAATQFSPLEMFGLLVASMAHDLDHPGCSNQFLIKSSHPLALMYNDTCINESHHCARLFQLTLRSPETNIFQNLSQSHYEELRRLIVTLILATDLGKHFEYLNKFKLKTAASASNSGATTPNSPNGTSTFLDLSLPEDRLLYLIMIIKCADLSNPSRDFGIYKKWVARVLEEFFNQGDKERDLGLPVSQFMDRLTTGVGKSQVSFIDFLVSPIYESFLPVQHEEFTKFCKTIVENRTKWIPYMTTLYHEVFPSSVGNAPSGSLLSTNTNTTGDVALANAAAKRRLSIIEPQEAVIEVKDELSE